MKCDLSDVENSLMSVEGCSAKLRIFVLVVSTANFINERATPTLGISHALSAPTAIFTTYIFMGIFVIGAFRNHYASYFLQIYALIACCVIQITLAFIVFRELRSRTVGKQHAALVLDGVLPMINAVFLLIDLTGIIFSNRREMTPPSSILRDSRSSQLEVQQRI